MKTINHSVVGTEPVPLGSYGAPLKQIHTCLFRFSLSLPAVLLHTDLGMRATVVAQLLM